MRGGLCETCLDPGHCCRRMFVSGRGIDLPMSHDRAEHAVMAQGLPFRPAEQLEDGRWTFWCTALGEDGRCTIYEERPALCRSYAAGSDPLCVHYQAAPERLAA